MEQQPDIVMQCPKCGRDFPPDVVYCDACSAMLEPVERYSAPGKPPVILKIGPEGPSDSERIEDTNIESMKSDIERRFARTVILELSQLTARIRKRETMMSGRGSTRRGEFASMVKGEAEADETLKKIARLEAILENLRKKLEADIGELASATSTSGRPPLTAWFSEKARCHRAMHRTLKAKTKLLEQVTARQVPSPFPVQRMVAASAVLFVIVILGISASLFVKHRMRGPGDPAVSSRQTAQAISAQEVYRLLDDVRTANLKKDFSLWESCYTNDFLSKGDRRESQIEQWRRYDYRALSYRIESIEVGRRNASAVIAWEMVLSTAGSSETTIVAQRLLSDFVLDRGMVKIANVRKTDRSP